MPTLEFWDHRCFTPALLVRWHVGRLPQARIVSGEDLFQVALQLPLGLGADHLIDLLATLEHQQGGNAHNAEAGSGV